MQAGIQTYCLERGSKLLGYREHKYYIAVAPITQLHMCVIKKSNIQGRSPTHNVLKVIFHTILWEQILSFKRSSHFEKGRNWKGITAWSSSLPLMYVTFSAFWLRHWLGQREHKYYIVFSTMGLYIPV